MPLCRDHLQSHYYILTPESKRPYFNEHCLVSNLVCQYSVRAVGKYTVKVLRMHPTYFKEFLMTSEVRACTRDLTRRRGRGNASAVSAAGLRGWVCCCRLTPV